ncbi:MAG: hypothetical protein JST00_36435 [Deltaproteobacteria bacterium]|nr:hypothetical protein [Deltaproteobacteria bacterium]
MLVGLIALSALAGGIVAKRDHATESSTTTIASARVNGTSALATATLGAASSAEAPSRGATGPEVAEAGPRDGDERAEHLAAFRRALASDDLATRIGAVERAKRTTDVATLSDLVKVDIARDPDVAPTVIHTVSLLGASGDEAKRGEASSALTRWLHQETKRDAPDAPGNVSNLVEALGDLGGRDAVDALVASLDRGELPLHVQTLAVQKLGECGDTRARPAVERFEARTRALPPGEGIEAELRTEALDAARQTLQRL